MITMKLWKIRYGEEGEQWPMTVTFTAVAAQGCIVIEINPNCFTIADQGKRNARTTISYECKNNISK